MTPIDFLSDEEVAVLTRPRIQAAAQRRYLDHIGIPYICRPDGRPVVSREALTERLAMGGARAPASVVKATSATPNRAATLAHLGTRKKGN